MLPDIKNMLVIEQMVLAIHVRCLSVSPVNAPDTGLYVSFYLLTDDHEICACPQQEIEGLLREWGAC